MNANEFNYDVAFSFLSKDEALATQINDLLQDRAKTFLYTKKQEQIAGTDGEKTFNAVFGKEARVVVLLYRDGWGQTAFTRIEETAIRNRGFDQGYEFLLCIPLGESPAVPAWFPKPNLWFGLNRWGIEGAASVIENCIQRQGGQPHEETVQERASRLKRSLAFDGKQKNFLSSEEGVKVADEEFELLRTELQRLTKEIGISFGFNSHENHFVVVGMGFGLGIEWRRHWANSLDNAKLTIGLWKGHPPLHFPGQIRMREPTQIRKIEFTFDLLPPDQRRWVTISNQTRAFTANELAQRLLKDLMDQCEPGKVG